MINERNVKLYCVEDISLIENYELAINDKDNLWVCHHRLETDLCLSKDELIDLRLYVGRPAKELIFLTRKEHRSVHSKQQMKGSHLTDEWKKHISKSTSGEKNGMFGYVWSEEQRSQISKKLFEYYKTHKNAKFNTHLSEETKQKLRKPKKKFKWLTPEGEIKIMPISNVKQHHPDWIKIGEV